MILIGVRPQLHGRLHDQLIQIDIGAAISWERKVVDPLLCEDIAACADLDPSRRLPDARALVQRLSVSP